MKKLLLAFVFLTAFFVIGCAVPQEPVVQQTSTYAPPIQHLPPNFTLF